MSRMKDLLGDVPYEEYMARLNKPKKKPLHVEHIATNLLSNSITISINGQRYEYFIDGNVTQIQNKFNFIREKSSGRALIFLKKCAMRVQKL